MPRAKVTDFIHSFRFYVEITGFGDPAFGGGSDKQLIPDGQNYAGFNSVSTPELSHDAAEYREGTYTYTRKYPGIPTVADITLSRGLAHKDGTFFNWMKDVVEGNAEYRANIDIYHLHRDSKPATDTSAITFGYKDPPTVDGFLLYQCRECIPLRVKVAGDLDATASEVSISEMDISMEAFTIEDRPKV
jgi:phage tail-like protein